MRKAVVALSLTTVFFATLAAYLARELWLVRSHDAGVASSATSPPVASVPRMPAPAVSGGESKPAPDGESWPRVTTASVHASDTDHLKQAREFLAARSNPDSWQKIVDNEKNMHRMMDPTLARLMGLDAVAYDRFLEALATQELAMREKAYRCMLDSHCQYNGLDQAFLDSLALETSAAVGPEIYRQYETLRDTRSERETVTQMRGRLADKDYLPDAKAEQFALAMADERKRIEREAVSQRLNFGSFGNGNITIYTSNDPAMAGVADALNRRLSDRAAQVLTPAQLAVYQQMQEEAKTSYLSMADMSELAAAPAP